ncbi:Tripartite motif-containing protein 30A [Apodemus speciosus]|uniref:Tripartite motif-containing protein 30A n=1 Tax=Apodemus speciosus TaxID=105296 RepID=A0ABQ0EZV0_APOSI
MVDFVFFFLIFNFELHQEPFAPRQGTRAEVLWHRITAMMTSSVLEMIKEEVTSSAKPASHSTMSPTETQKGRAVALCAKFIIHLGI